MNEFFNVPLAVFGCSWTKSFVNIRDPMLSLGQSIGEVLSAKLGSSIYVDMGIEGASNTRSVLQLLDYVKRQDLQIKGSIAVFLLTAKERNCTILDDGSVVDFQIFEPHTPMTEAYYKYFSSVNNLNFDLQKNILAMQAICRAYFIRDYYVGTWHDETYDFYGVEMTKIYPKTCIQMLGLKNHSEYAKSIPSKFILQCGHPNRFGNEIIANELHQWIVGSF